MKKRALHICLFIGYLIGLAWLCFGKFDSVDTSIPLDILGIPTDKIVHFLMFFPFPLLCWLVFRGISRKPWHSVAMVLLIFVAGCLIAAGTELGQGYTTYRTPDGNDFFADALSLALASVVALILDIKYSLKTASQK